MPGLSAFAQRLTARRRGIFLPTGRAQEVIRLAGSLGEIDGQLQAVVGNADRYGSLTTRRAEIETGLHALDEETLPVEYPPSREPEPDLWMG